jgi:hypothetical protein
MTLMEFIQPETVDRITHRYDVALALELGEEVVVDIIVFG